MTLDLQNPHERDDPPEGYEPLVDTCEAELHAGPYYMHLDGAEAAIGFRVKHRHLNRAGLCHGGVLATLADMAITPILRRSETPPFNLTISMTVDYLAAVRVGQWVEARATILRATRSVIFSQCLITADAEPAARASVIYKRGRLAPA